MHEILAFRASLSITSRVVYDCSKRLYNCFISAEQLEYLPALGWFSAVARTPSDPSCKLVPFWKAAVPQSNYSAKYSL